VSTLKQIIDQNDTARGRAFDIAIQALIVISLVTFSVETLPDLSPATRNLLRTIEVITVVIFTVEYILRIVVADNNSGDETARIARQSGAEVVSAARQGYGSACLVGLEHLRSTGAPDVVVFVDGDYSDHPEELPTLIAPIRDDGMDLVIGSRILGRRERGSLLPQARVGNWIATLLIRWMYGHRYTDLGPFRAVRWQALERLRMADPDFGWTAEMQVKAIRAGLRITEVPVSYRARVGVSKITGTLSGTLRAGYKILYTIVRYRVLGSTLFGDHGSWRQ